MILFILLQLFPIGLTGHYHSDPLYWAPGPRNIVILKSISKIDSTYVKNDSSRIIRPVRMKRFDKK
jgi:hypothetical protein